MEEGAKFTFKYEVNYVDQPKYSVTMESDAITLTEILTEFEQFLKGCGFVFDGELTINYSGPCEDCSCQENQD